MSTAKPKDTPHQELERMFDNAVVDWNSPLRFTGNADEVKAEMIPRLLLWRNQAIIKELKKAVKYWHWDEEQHKESILDRIKELESE